MQDVCKPLTLPVYNVLLGAPSIFSNAAAIEI